MPSGAITNRLGMSCRRHGNILDTADIIRQTTASSGTIGNEKTTLPFTDPQTHLGAVKAEDLIGLFECPVCFDYAIPPILQCQSGHLVCQSCREKLTFCPACRGAMGNIRNLAMEKVASTIQFPCKYSNLGCLVTMMHTHKLNHEDACEFRPYSCPCPGSTCRWTGSLESVIPHLQTVHKSITTLQGEDIVFLATDITLPGAVDWVMMQVAFNHHFILILEKQEQNGECMFFAVVYIVGTRKEAQNFNYRLELHNPPLHRLLAENVPRSIHEGVTQAVFRQDCLRFDATTANKFADNGNLGINVAISMVEQPRDGRSYPSIKTE